MRQFLACAACLVLAGCLPAPPQPAPAPPTPTSSRYDATAYGGSSRNGVDSAVGRSERVEQRGW